MKDIMIDNVELSVRYGSNIDEALEETFAWFYPNKDIKKCTLCHLNGIAVTFERECDV
jgi:hypothetical protein